MFKRNSPTSIDFYALEEGDEFVFVFYERLMYCKVVKSPHKRSNGEVITVDQTTIRNSKNLFATDRHHYSKSDLTKKTHISEQSFSITDFDRMGFFFNELFESTK